MHDVTAPVGLESHTLLVMYRLILALMVGCAFIGLISLSLNFHSQLALFTSLFLFPGAVGVGLFIKPGLSFGPPFAVLVTNSLFYSAITFVALVFWNAVDVDRIKSATRWLVLPAVLIAGLAVVPKLNPLWPKGMSQLDEKERSLRNGLPIGSRLDSVREFLRIQKVESYEFESKDEEPIFDNGHTKIVAKIGERVITAKIQTDAEQFPCGYVIQVVLVFDNDQKLREQYVERKVICP